MPSPHTASPKHDQDPSLTRRRIRLRAALGSLLCGLSLAALIVAVPASTDGAHWGGDTRVQDVGMSSSPSAAAWANGITVLHQGPGNNGQLLYTYSADGTHWGGDTRVQNVGMSSSPSAVVF